MSASDYPTWEEFTTTSFAARHEWPLLAPETPDPRRATSWASWPSPWA